MVVGDIRKSLTAEVEALNPRASDGFGRDLGPGFSGSLSARGELAVQQRSPGRTGQPTRLVVRRGSSAEERRVFSSRWVPGTPDWGADETLYATFFTHSRSVLVSKPWGERIRTVRFARGVSSQSVLVSSRGELAVADDGSSARTLFLGSRGRSAHDRPLVGYLPLAWSPSGGDLLIVSKNRTRLYAFDTKRRHKRLVATTSGEAYAGVWG
jgi:hypothetical protein